MGVTTQCVYLISTQVSHKGVKDINSAEVQKNIIDFISNFSTEVDQCTVMINGCIDVALFMKNMLKL